MKHLYSTILLSIIICGCNDDKVKSHFGFKNYSNENSYSEFLLRERGDAEYDTLYKVYINFDLDSVSLDCGKYIDYNVSKEFIEYENHWEITYFAGSQSFNRQKSKKFRKKDVLSVGNCFSNMRIGNGHAYSFVPVKPKTLEDAFFLESKLHFIHSWLVKTGKITSYDKLILVQLSNNSYCHSASIQTVN